MMSQKTIILTVLLFALIVMGMFTYARLRHHEIKAGDQARSPAADMFGLFS